MHFFDTSAYDKNRGYMKYAPKGPRLEEGLFEEGAFKNQLSAKGPHNFSNPGFSPTILAKLPAESFALIVEFSLMTPYLSKDDGYPADERSSIVKDWVYQIPMVRPTTWKGRLRFSAAQQESTQIVLDHLFGPPTDCDEGQEGRLHFFPTFFVQTADGQEVRGVEIINPHSRSTRRGRSLGPVELKSVKAETEGTLCLLYLGPTIPGIDLETTKKSVISWVCEMIEFHGIGGKTLKGFGLGSIRTIFMITDTGKTPIPIDREGGLR